MTATIEISFYPLIKDYPASVLLFLNELEVIPGFEIQTNGMSTIVIGDFEHLWSRLGMLMANQLSNDHSIFVMKVAPGRREYN